MHLGAEGAGDGAAPGRAAGGASPAPPPLGGADPVGRVLLGDGTQRVSHANRRSRSTAGQPAARDARRGHVHRALRCLGLATHPRRAHRHVARPARADGRTPDRFEDRHGGVHRRVVPEDDARQAVLSGAVGHPHVPVAEGEGQPMQTTAARSSAFDRFAGTAAMVVGLGGIVYAILFITLLHKATNGAAAASALLLMVGGVATTAVLIAVYGRLAPVDPGF